MKKTNFFPGIAIAIIGLTTFACMNKQQVTGAHDLDTRTIESSGASADFVATDLFNIDPSSNEVNLSYIVRGNYRRTTTKEQLTTAETLNDIIEGYPSSWIESYTSVEVSTTNKNEKITTTSSNATLTAEQKNMFKKVGLASVIDIKVQYKMHNSVSNESMDKEMNVALTIIPEVEAAYIGGRVQMEADLKAKSSEKTTSYLKAKSKAIIFDNKKNMDQFNVSRILFTVNELGAVENVRVVSTSGDAAVDQELISLIENMPKWKPAENAAGKKVSQEFEFIVGMGGC